MLVVRENGEQLEIIEEEPSEVECEEQITEGGTMENLNIELSINSVVGLTNLGTMKVKGKVKEEEVVVLIDYGATHNFIYEKLVTKLNLPIKATTNYVVILDFGTSIKGKGVCGKVEVLIGEWKIIDSFLLLELGGVDVIVGMQWLHSLGVTEVDWRNLVLTIQHESKKVIIRGDPSLT